ncbi:uncharacterized protein LOC132723646 [Ruditapes philippinarum]|uniref:uncharacterized protein LOC132723646 n=1 Tax=Ruditapes philippinarum TaxID=129788 RepID=UPI00295B583E|nr:uncharacterized protein LOC132723646 [Ruditapes philippinarum]
MASFRRIFLLFFLLSASEMARGGTVPNSPCSSANRAANTALCLNAINDLLFDTSKFWFGDEYVKNCPNGMASGMQCANPKPSGTNLANRTFTNTSIVENVDRFLELHFESGGKNYTACGNHFVTNETWSQDIDPTSDVIVYPWYVRHFPASVNWDYDSGDLFTLMVYDIGYFVSHGIYVNIEGDDMTTAEVIKEYHGPLVSTQLHIPYMFMLFKQNGRVSVTEEWKTKVNYENWGLVWTVEEFLSSINLNNMVAVNWIVATGDAYAAQTMMDNRVIVMCPAYVTKAIHEKPRPFIPQYSMLSVMMDIEFMSEGGNLTVCCKDYTYAPRDFKLNPIGNPIFNTFDVRTGTPYALSLMKMGMYQTATVFSGDVYTLITVDPDVPYPNFGTEERPLLHGMVTNIINGNLSTGDVGLAYQGPAPPDNKPHYYYFLLYKQQAEVNVTKMMNYVGDNCGTRCLYNINLAVAENGLTLVGATWLRATTDEYVIYRNIERDNNEAQQCQGREGYENPCPVSKEACSPDNRARDLSTCLKGIEQIMYDTDNFWFGDDYSKTCPRGEASGDFCHNPSPLGTSIATRVFTSLDALNRISLDRFLNLHFESTGKDYTACGNTFKTTEVWRMDVNPTSDVIVYPWYVKNFPVTVSWDYTAGDQFTLMVYDVGYLITHAVYTNIQGNDMTSADDIKPYHGPLVTNDMHNPYIFLLFKQNGPITVSEAWKTKVRGQGEKWTIDEFATAYNLQGPVAVNWIVATGDEWAAETMMSRQLSANCPVFVTRAMHEKPRPFIPQNTSLSVWVDLKFMTEDYKYTVCCKEYEYSAREFSLNPIGNPVYPTWEVRTETKHTVTFMKQGTYSQAQNFTGDWYTMITLDPDVPSSTAGTEERPLLHGIVTNIMDGNVSTGHVGRAYSGPTPPDNKPHYYYTLLYKQKASLNATEMLNYADSSCSGGLVGRCLFDINRLVSENDLTLVGATWFRSTTDDYVYYRQIARNPSQETTICKGGYSNYIDPTCPVASSNILIPSFVSIFIVAFIANLFTFPQ